ncbi:hypothetical protein Tco_1210936 [Tanacetum coccineum]
MAGYKQSQLKNKSFVEIQKLFDKAMTRVNMFVDMDTELVKESSKKAEAEVAQESSSKRAGKELEHELVPKEVVNQLQSKIVVNAVKGNNVNAVKASACWVWKPKTNVLDHVSKHNSASITLKKFDYVDAQGRPSILIEIGVPKKKLIILIVMCRTMKRLMEDMLPLEETPKEGKSQEKGSGPNCLFDIDALTKSMNYKPVVAGNQSNGNAGTKACDDAGSDSSNDQEKDDNVNSTNNVNASSTNKVNVIGGKTSIELPDDPNMPALEDIVYSDDDDDVGAEVDINNLDAFMHVSPILTTRVQKDHLVEQIIRDLNSAPQTRKKTKNLEEHDCNKWKKEDGIFISHDKYVTEILKKSGFTDVKTASTPMETQKLLLKDEDGEEVDVYLYRSMIGSLMYLTSSRPDIMFLVCACARYQVNPKVSHLHAVKRIFRYLKGQPKLGLWYPKDLPFDLAAYTDSDYARASLDRKSITGGFANEKKVDSYVKIHTTRMFEDLSYNKALITVIPVCHYKFMLHNLLLLLKVNAARHNLLLLLKVNATRHKLTTAVETLVDGKKIIVTEASVRCDLKLNDEEGMVKKEKQRTLENVSGKFLMYPRFVQVFLEKQLEGISNYKRIYVTPSHTKKIFGNMRRVGKGFSGRETPLFPIMMVQAQEEMGEGSANTTDPHHTPTIIQPSTSQPQKKQKPRKPKRKDTKVPQPSGPTDNVVDKAVYEEMDDSLERATTTATSLDTKQDRGNINKTQSKATLNEPSSLGTSSGSGPKRQETIGNTIAQTGFENVSKTSNDSLLVGVNTTRCDEDSLKLKELMELCTNLQNRVIDLEKTKTSLAQEITSLKRRVKRLEKKGGSRTHGLKRLYKVSLSRRIESSEDEGLGEEDASKQGRINVMGVIVETKVDHEVVVETEVASKDVNLSVDEVTLAQALAALKSAKPKFRKDKAKGKMVKPKPVNKLSKKNQFDSDEELGPFQATTFKKKKEEILIKQMAQQSQAEEQEKLCIKEKSKLFVQLLEARKKHFAAMRA